MTYSDGLVLNLGNCLHLLLGLRDRGRLELSGCDSDVLLLSLSDLLAM